MQKTTDLSTPGATTSNASDAVVVASTAAAPAVSAAAEPARAPPVCRHFADATDPVVLREPDGARRMFSWDGYDGRFIALREHCVTVAWPGEHATTPRAPDVARRIDDGWLRLIENSLARLPAAHASRVQRVVIDDRPTEHGIAPFDRRDATDARDGRTIWLHHRLFTEPNHWAHGNFGSYWSYHVQDDGVVVDDKPKDHTLFSPVLLHEIGHLVGYTLAKADVQGENVPACAVMCGDRGDCKKLSPAEREQGCISPYCMAFKVGAGTENWAEQYRLFFQGSGARRLLESAKAGCVDTLRSISAGTPDPWANGPDLVDFHRSRWASCGERVCKAY